MKLDFKILRFRFVIDFQFDAFSSFRSLIIHFGLVVATVGIHSPRLFNVDLLSWHQPTPIISQSFIYQLFIFKLILYLTASSDTFMILICSITYQYFSYDF